MGAGASSRLRKLKHDRKEILSDFVERVEVAREKASEKIEQLKAVKPLIEKRIQSTAKSLKDTGTAFGFVEPLESESDSDDGEPPWWAAISLNDFKPSNIDPLAAFQDRRRYQVGAIQEVYMLFCEADVSKRGEISYVQFVDIMGLQVDAFSLRIFQAYDVDFSDTLDFQEFLFLCRYIQDDVTLDVKTQFCFRLLDLDDDGQITKDEFCKLLCLLSYSDGESACMQMWEDLFDDLDSQDVDIENVLEDTLLHVSKPGSPVGILVEKAHKYLVTSSVPWFAKKRMLKKHLELVNRRGPGFVSQQINHLILISNTNTEADLTVIIDEDDFLDLSTLGYASVTFDVRSNLLEPRQDQRESKMLLDLLPETPEEAALREERQKLATRADRKAHHDPEYERVRDARVWAQRVSQVALSAKLGKIDQLLAPERVRGYKLQKPKRTAMAASTQRSSRPPSAGTSRSVVSEVGGDGYGAVANNTSLPYDDGNIPTGALLRVQDEMRQKDVLENMKILSKSSILRASVGFDFSKTRVEKKEGVDISDLEVSAQKLWKMLYGKKGRKFAADLGEGDGNFPTQWPAQFPPLPVQFTDQDLGYQAGDDMATPSGKEKDRLPSFNPRSSRRSSMTSRPLSALSTGRPSSAAKKNVTFGAVLSPERGPSPVDSRDTLSPAMGLRPSSASSHRKGSRSPHRKGSSPTSRGTSPIPASPTRPGSSPTSASSSFQHRGSRPTSASSRHSTPRSGRPGSRLGIEDVPLLDASIPRLSLRQKRQMAALGTLSVVAPSPVPGGKVSSLGTPSMSMVGSPSVMRSPMARSPMRAPKTPIRVGAPGTSLLEKTAPDAGPASVTSPQFAFDDSEVLGVAARLRVFNEESARLKSLRIADMRAAEQLRKKRERDEKVFNMIRAVDLGKSVPEAPLESSNLGFAALPYMRKKKQQDEAKPALPPPRTPHARVKLEVPSELVPDLTVEMPEVADVPVLARSMNVPASAITGASGRVNNQAKLELANARKVVFSKSRGDEVRVRREAKTPAARRRRALEGVSEFAAVVAARRHSGDSASGSSSS